jgi:hypothetical protein
MGSRMKFRVPEYADARRNLMYIESRLGGQSIVGSHADNELRVGYWDYVQSLEVDGKGKDCTIQGSRRKPL